MRNVYLTALMACLLSTTMSGNLHASLNNNNNEGPAAPKAPAATSQQRMDEAREQREAQKQKLIAEREAGRKQLEEQKKAKAEHKEDFVKSNAAIRESLVAQNKDLEGLKGKYQYKGNDKAMLGLSKAIQENINTTIVKNTRYAEFLEKNPTMGKGGAKVHYQDQLGALSKNLSDLRKQYDDLAKKAMGEGWIGLEK